MACNELIRKVYLYSNMGFPVALVTVEESKVKVEGNQKPLPVNLERAVLILAKVLPKVVNKEEIHHKNQYFELHKKKNILIIKNNTFTLKVRIEK